jgi:hypothetical protein
VAGVVSAEVDCTSGTAICKVEKGTSTDALIEAVGMAGFDAAPKN